MEIFLGYARSGGEKQTFKANKEAFTCPPELNLGVVVLPAFFED